MTEIRRGTDLKMFLYPTQFARADAEGFIIHERDGTFTLRHPELPMAQVFVTKMIPQQ